MRKRKLSFVALSVLAGVQALAVDSGNVKNKMVALRQAMAERQSADDGAAGQQTDAGAEVSINVDYSKDGGSRKPVVGFVHGIGGASSSQRDFPPATKDKIAALQPSLWKVSDPEHYSIAKQYNPQIIIPPADTLYDYNPTPEPWEDWGAYENHFYNMVAAFKQRNQPVDYWNVWNEPQMLKYKEPGLVAEAFKRGYQSIKSADPAAKVIAPSTIGFSDKVMAPFLEYAAKNNLIFDAYNWHEFGRPELLPEHVRTMRALLARHPSLGNPPFIIDEFATPEQHLQPGFAVAWFYYLEAAGIELSARACWDVVDKRKWSDCWDGLDGLFLKDNDTPQPLYWVFDAYSKLTGPRLATSSSDGKDAVALAAKSGNGLSIIAGRFHDEKNVTGTKTVNIILANLPKSSGAIHVTVYKIPNPRLTPHAMPKLAKVYEGDAPLSSSSVSLPLKKFGDGEAYLLEVGL